MHSFWNRIKKAIGLLRNKSSIFYVLFAILMVFILANKKNLHEDEVFTYGLANNQVMWQMSPEDMKVYSPSEMAWVEYVAVHRGEQFDFKNVWKNQSMDVHPPIYYVLVHIICSLFPEKFSIWFAGIINIIFALLALCVVRCLLKELTRSDSAVIFGTIFFILSAGILSEVSFLRMYMMSMFEVTYVTLLFVQAKEREHDWKFRGSLIVMSVLGALTHYYFIIYLFFLCWIFGGYWLFNKKYKDVGFLSASMLTAGIFAIAIFPSIISHMFYGSGGRGKQSIDNLLQISFSAYWGRLKFFYDEINEQLCGGALPYLFIAILFVFLYYKINHDKIVKVGQERGYISEVGEMTNKVLIMLPSILYYLLVSKIAVAMFSRYLFPIYGVVTVGFICLLYYAVEKIIKKSRKRIVIICLFLSVVIVNSWKLCTWDTLYLDSEALLKKSAQYKEEDAVCIYNMGWMIHSLFYEASNYNSITFLRENSIEMLSDISENNSLIVIIDASCDTDEILEEVQKRCPYLNNYTEIGSFQYTKSYYFYT